MSRARFSRMPRLGRRWAIFLIAAASLLLALVLSDCSRRRQTDIDVSIVTETPTPPAGVPVPAPTPTPLSPPDQLARARTQERNGYLDEAARTYATLARGADPDIAWQSAYFLGRMRFHQDQYQAARPALERFLALVEPAPVGEAALYVPGARLLLAETLRGLGDFAGAEEAYRAALEGQDPIAYHIHRQWGQMRLDQGAEEQGLQLLTTAAEQAPNAVTEVWIRSQMASAHEAQGRFGQAVEEYDRILDVSRIPAFRARIQYQAGIALLQMEEQAAAMHRFRLATEESPEDIFAYLALVQLVEHEEEFDLYQRGYIDYQAGVNDMAVAAFADWWTETDGEDPRYPWSLLYAGHSHFGLGSYAQAAPLYQRVVDEYPPCDCAGDAWQGLLNTYRAVGNEADYQRTAAQFREILPRHPLRADLLAQEGYAWLERHEVERATAVFWELAELFPEDGRSPQALFDLALHSYLHGDPATANEGWDRLRDLYVWYRAPEVGFWTARTLWDMDQREAAEFAWSRTWRTYPETFFGIMSAQAVARGDGTSQGAIPNMENLLGPGPGLPDDDGSLAFALRWLDTWADAAPPVREGQLRVETDPDFQRGEAYWRLGMRDEAIDYWGILPVRYGQDAGALLYLARHFAELREVRLSILSGRQLYFLSPSYQVVEQPLFLQRLLFPLPYADLVETVIQEHDLPKLLFYSLLRQESLFEPISESGAFAQGLAQVIPDTGDWVAWRTGFPDYQADALWLPWVNLQFGAYYLRYVHDNVDGNWITSLVSYNAGPENGRIFRASGGPDDLLFLDAITIQEPVDYVHAIVINLYHYTRLYGGEAQAPSS